MSGIRDGLYKSATAFALRSPVRFSLAAYAASFLIALPFARDLLGSWLLSPKRVYDHNIYMNIAIQGYQQPAEPAFYPLWPWILSLFAGLPEGAMTVASNLLALSCFAAALAMLVTVLRKLGLPEWCRVWAVLAFAVNPNSVFHGIGYPESFFSLLVTLTLNFGVNWLRDGRHRDLWTSLFFCALIGMTRPIFPQMALSAIAAFAIWTLTKARTSPSDMKGSLLVFLAGLVAACAIGYVPFGYLCLRTFNNFWQPFDAQSYWDRQPGLHWSLLTNPKSVGGSDNVLTWDLQSFYLPVALVAILTLASKTLRIKNATAWMVGLFAALIAAAHSGIAFVTYPIFMSIGRHVLATPFFYVAAAVVLCQFSDTKRLRTMAFTWVVIEWLYLIHFWTRFARVSWIG